MEKKNKVMKHGSLFSGIGGFDLAADWMEWQNVFHCEWEDFPRKALHHYWPNAISYGDIKQTDFAIHRGQIDILTGGFPCQPYSQAGKRLGKEDDRHLWPEMLRAIREIQPTWIVGENVRGLVNWSGGLVFEEVQTDLEAEGYEVQPFILPACAVNAPHRRDRVWFVAHSESERDLREGRSQNLTRREKGNTGIRTHIQYEPNDNGKIRPTPDTGNEGLQGGEIKGGIGRGGKKRDKQSAGLLFPDWENFPTQSPICSRNDGIPGKLDGITFSKWRTESIKAYGNAVVPQVVLQIFKTIQEYENQQRAILEICKKK